MFPARSGSIQLTSNLPTRDDMPPHWHLKFNLSPPWSMIAKVSFQCALISSVGHPNLEHLWLIATNGESLWVEHKQRLLDRITSLTVIAGLIIAVITAFITTNPPLQSLLDYNQRATYYLLLVSFSIALGGLIFGSAMVFVLAKCTAKWATRTLLGTRSRIICTMLIIGYPIIAIGLSVAFLAAGLVVAAINSKDPLMRIGSTMTLAIPVFLCFAFLWTQIPHGRELSDAERELSY